jgi:sialate O-acetylesterase
MHPALAGGGILMDPSKPRSVRQLLHAAARAVPGGADALARLRVDLNAWTPSIKARVREHPRLELALKKVKHLVAPPGPTSIADPYRASDASELPRPATPSGMRLAGIFSDHMVLQRDRLIPVWGRAPDGQTIEVRFKGASARTTAREGRFRVDLPPQAAGGPFTIEVIGRDRLEVRDVLVGDVWLCSGQSNMEWRLVDSDAPKQAISLANNPALRLYTVPRRKAESPAGEVEAVWKRCDSAAAMDFSAVAFYFGRDLQVAQQVPIGLIAASWGGSPIESWMPLESLAEDELFSREVLAQVPEAMRAFDEALARWEEQAEALAREGRRPAAERPWWNWRPAELFNGMIAPLLPFPVRGFTWYQGEANIDRPELYSRLFSALIASWRKAFGPGELPFLAAQIAPWDRDRCRSLEEITRAPEESAIAELREAQALTARTVPGVGLAVTLDVGEKDDIHPPRKREVGTRLSLLARSMAYGERLTASGPAFCAAELDGDRLILSFDGVGSGLEARGGALQGFAVAGADGVFRWAEARIEGATVILRREGTGKPVAARYAWADFPVGNLFNREGLPAAPFRTDAPAALLSRAVSPDRAVP